MGTELVPAWVRLWYLFNIVTLVPDWIYMELRPHTLRGGELAWAFPFSNLYATIDRLLYEYHDNTARILYRLDAIDVILCCGLYIFFNLHAKKASFAVLAICRAIFVATRTTVYVMYSREFVARGWYGLVLFLNGAWFVVPLLVVVQTAEQLAYAIQDGCNPAGSARRYEYYADII